jgi:hypothetical protein
MTTAMLVMLAVGALAASLGLLMAHLHFSGVAHLFAVTATVCGIAAFVTVALSTIRRARQLPWRSRQP